MRLEVNINFRLFELEYNFIVFCTAMKNGLSSEKIQVISFGNRKGIS